MAIVDLPCFNNSLELKRAELISKMLANAFSRRHIAFKDKCEISQYFITSERET